MRSIINETIAMTSNQDPIYPLASARPGEHVRVVDVQGSKTLKKRLVSMGILSSSRLHVIQRRGSALVIGFDASRIAIGSGMSQHILVSAA
jgi:Fe2+ transport system protein FeoA